MIFDYTLDEMVQFTEIDDYYAGLADKVDAAAAADPEYNGKEYPEKYIEQKDRLNAECMDRLGALYDKFEKERFDALGGDPDAILANGKEQIDTAVKTLYNGNKVLGKADPRIEKDFANNYLNMEIRRHLEFLKVNAKKQYDSLQRYRRAYIKKSPFIIHEEPIQGGVTQPRQVPQLSESQRDLFKSDIITTLGGSLTDILYNLSLKSFPQVLLRGETRKATVNGIEVTIEGDFPGDDMGTSALKIWDAITAYLYKNNTYRAKKNINTTVEIPLDEYAEVRKVSINPREMPTQEEQGEENRLANDRKKKFKKDIRRDLDRLSKFRLTGKEKKGKNAGDYNNLVLVYPDHKIENGIIRVHIPNDTAKYLLSSYPMFYAPELQGLSDTNPNAYRIGRAIYRYNSIDRNARRGTNTTLKVSTLVSFTNHIPTKEQLESRGQRNWQDKIKTPLEKVFARLAEAGILLTWHYEDPGKDHKEISPQDAEELSLNTYWNLNVKFQLKENKPQQERLENLETKAKRKAAAKKQGGNEVGTNGGTR